MEASTTFQERVAQLDARLRERVPTIAGAIECQRGEAWATWRHADAWGTLALHQTDEPPRLSLMLYRAKGTDEQDAIEVNIDEADVVDVLAEPLAGLFLGQVA